MLTNPQSTIRSDTKTLIVLILLVLLAYWKIIPDRGHTYFVGQDSAGQYYPWYQFAGSSWKSGSPPLWDPFSRGGRPFYDEMQPGAFHPLNLLMFLAPASNGGVDLRTMDLLIVLLAAIACAGEYSLLRSVGISSMGSFVGGIVYGLSGYSAYVVGHQAIFGGVIWLPWIFLFYLKSLGSKGWDRWRQCLLSGFFLGLTILAGHIQPPAHACLTLVFFASYYALNAKSLGTNRMFPFGLLAGTITFALFIAAIQLIPTYLYSRIAYRWVAGVQLDPSQKVPWSLHEVWSPAENLSLLVPAATTHMLYLGIGTLLLAVFGAIASKNRYRGLFSLLAVLSFLYAFGRLSALYAGVYLVLPFAEKVPEASRSFLVFHFAMAALAALGADLLFHPVPRSARRRYVITSNMVTVLSTGIFLVLVAVGLAKGLYEGPIKPESFIAPSYSAVLLLIGGSLIVLRRYSLLRLKFFKYAIAGLIAFDLVSFVQSHTPAKGAASADELYKPTPISRFLASRSGPFRVIDNDGVLPPNFGDAYRIENTFGYGATLRKDYLDFLYSKSEPEKALRMLNVRYYVTRKALAGLQLAFVDKQSGASVYEDPWALPRLALITKSSLSGNADLRLARLLLDKALNCAANGDPHCFDPETGWEAQILSYKPNSILIQTKAPDSAHLWLSELVYPGWEVYVDGTKRNLRVSDEIFRAVDLDPGEHRVEFRFRPKAVTAGFTVTTAAIILLMLVGTVSIYRKRNYQVKS